MEILNSIMQLESPTRLALGALSVTTVLWAIAMIATLFKWSAKTSGVRRREIAVIVLSLLFIASMSWAGRAMEAKSRPEPPQTAPATLTTGGGTGTCASIRTGMSASQVRKLLGTPSLEQSAEDTRGPGTSVMVFDDSRCVVHFLHGAVDQIE